MSVWPAWEVRESGGTMSWFTVRLAFADGACVEALAVVTGRQVSVEEVHARPALSPDDLGALGEWIEGAVFAACGLEARPRDRAADGPAVAPQPVVDAAACDAPDDGPDDGHGADRADVAHYADVAHDADDADVADEGEDSEAPDRSHHTHHTHHARHAHQPPHTHHSHHARPAWPRGDEGRRLVARAYLAAQRGGTDPVVAVMGATGRSRRKALRLIAQARDAGPLTPRHARR
ncbi:DUF6214 family protein [Streptomyces sp. NPDC088789]|uniref:DUF6214 family protein n=1 Tax=Streptomyces sp. NPDC088789 TaxID=3365899 RepID=UPI0037FC2ED2